VISRDGGEAPILALAIPEPVPLGDYFMDHAEIFTRDTAAFLERLQGRQRGRF
jgi:hypothetical protein